MGEGSGGFKKEVPLLKNEGVRTNLEVKRE